MKKILFAIVMLFCVPAWAGPQDLFDVNSTTAPVITCTTTPSSVAFGNASAPNMHVFNSGSDPVFLTTGDSTVTNTFPTSSAVTGMVVAPGAIESFSKLPQHTHISCDALSGSNIVYVTTSKGE